MTGKRISEHNETEKKRKSPYHFFYYILNTDREILYNRIEKRVDQMVKEGLIEEVESLANMGCNRNMVSMQGLGYKETKEYLDGKITKDEYNRKFIDNDAWEDSLVLYRKYMSDPESPFFIDMNDILPDIESIIKLIRRANGKVFIPHIFEYKHNSDKILNYILENFEIDGIECYYSNFTKEQTTKLLKICENRKILISGGSDYHGISEENKIDMGNGRGDLEIPDSIISEWI